MQECSINWNGPSAFVLQLFNFICSFLFRKEKKKRILHEVLNLFSFACGGDILVLLLIWVQRRGLWCNPFCFLSCIQLELIQLFSNVNHADRQYCKYPEIKNEITVQTGWKWLISYLYTILLNKPVCNRIQPLLLIPTTCYFVFISRTPRFYTHYNHSWETASSCKPFGFLAKQFQVRSLLCF